MTTQVHHTAPSAFISPSESFATLPSHASSRLDMQAWGGLSALLANREYIHTNVYLSQAELDYLIDVSETAISRLSLMMETIGRLLEANEHVEDVVYQVDSSTITRFMLAVHCELGGAMCHLAYMLQDFASAQAYNQGLIDGENEMAKVEL